MLNQTIYTTTTRSDLHPTSATQVVHHRLRCAALLERQIYYNELCPTSTMLFTPPGGLVVERSPGVWEVVGLIPSWVIPKTLKWYLTLPCY